MLIRAIFFSAAGLQGTTASHDDIGAFHSAKDDADLVHRNRVLPRRLSGTAAEDAEPAPVDQRETASSWDSKAGRAYWEKDVNPQFAHLGMDPHALRKSWNRWWANRLLADISAGSVASLQGQRLLEYGIGNGALALFMIEKFHIGSYVGVDISQRNLRAVNGTLARSKSAAQVSEWRLLQTPVSFAAHQPQIIFTQAVIQHFPGLDYLHHFLNNVESSGAKLLVFQHTHAGSLSPHEGCAGLNATRAQKESTAVYEEKKRQFTKHQVYSQLAILRACSTTTAHLASRLPSYRLHLELPTEPPLKKDAYVYTIFVRKA